MNTPVWIVEETKTETPAVQEIAVEEVGGEAWRAVWLATLEARGNGRVVVHWKNGETPSEYFARKRRERPNQFAADAGHVLPDWRTTWTDADQAIYDALDDDWLIEEIAGIGRPNVFLRLAYDEVQECEGQPTIDHQRLIDALMRRYRHTLLKEDATRGEKRGGI